LDPIAHFRGIERPHRRPLNRADDIAGRLPRREQAQSEISVLFARSGGSSGRFGIFPALMLTLALRRAISMRGMHAAKITPSNLDTSLAPRPG